MRRQARILKHLQDSRDRSSAVHTGVVTHICRYGSFRSNLLAALLLVALLTVLACADMASADVTFCSPGSGAGECSQPLGLATNFETGRLYVADSENNRIDVFEATGSAVEFAFAFGWGVADGTTKALQTCTATCFKGLAGSGAGQLSGPSYVAVDNGISPSNGDVYVTDAGNSRVVKFDPSGSYLGVTFGSAGSGPGKFETMKGIGVTAAGVVYVADSRDVGQGCNGIGEFTKRVQKFDETGGFLEEVDATSELCGRVSAFATDQAGSFYFSNEGPGQALRKYNASGANLCTIEQSTAEWAFTADGAGNLYAAQGRSDSGILVTEYDAGCNYVRRFGYGSFSNNVGGVAVLHSQTGDIFASELDSGNGPTAVKYMKAPPAGPVVWQASVEAPGATVGNTKAVLDAKFNPEGELSAYHFEYVDQEGFEEQGDSFVGPHTKSTSDAQVGSAGDFSLHAATALIGCPIASRDAIEKGECLIPETAYRVRLVVENGDGEGNGPIEASFQTREPVDVGRVWSAQVGAESAVLNVEVDPLGVSSTGFFEYVTDASYREDGFARAVRLPGSGSIEFGAGEAFVTRNVAATGLAPGVVYHYRLRATDVFLEEAGGQSALSGEGAFTTFFPSGGQEPCPANDAFRIGASASLPDCRAYEMVSPVDKEGGDVVPLKEIGTGLRATLDQSARDGSKLAYGAYRAFGDAESAPFTAQYVAMRTERGQEGEGWSSHSISPPRERLNVQSAGTLWSELELLSPDLCRGWSTTFAEPQLTPEGVPGRTNIYRRTDQAPDCGGVLGWEAVTTLEPPHQEKGGLVLQGASADGSAAIYMSNDNLTPDAPNLKGDGRGLYYRKAGGATSYVCILPNGKPITGSCSAGAGGGDNGQVRESSVYHAISADSTRVFWTTPGLRAGKIYLRENPDQPQSVSGKCDEPGTACTVAVSQKAEELSGASASTYLDATVDGAKVFFTAENSSAAVSDLYEFDVETGTTTLIAHKSAGVQGAGVMGASDDGSYLYFASGEVLAGANPQGRSPVAGEPNLYLRHEGLFHFVATLVASTDVSSDFAAIRFEPGLRTSRVTSDGLHAVFMSTASLTGYDNIDLKTGQVDTEVFLYDASANGGGGKLVCASCNPSGARPTGVLPVRSQSTLWTAGRLPVWASNFYPSHFLSEDGRRLFFESSDALSLRDSNGVLDVYEWQEAGTGGCHESDADYSKQDEGCVDLISSGESASGSELVDASPTGDDVFIATLSSLVVQDDGLVDIYDARVNGGFAPPPGAPAQCEGEACLSPPVAPIDATPASVTFTGPGDSTSGPPVHVEPKSKGLTRGQRLAKALTACHRIKAKRKRTTCVAQAHKRYGAKQARKANSKRSGR